MSLPTVAGLWTGKTENLHNRLSALDNHTIPKMLWAGDHQDPSKIRMLALSAMHPPCNHRALQRVRYATTAKQCFFSCTPNSIGAFQRDVPCTVFFGTSRLQQSCTTLPIMLYFCRGRGRVEPRTELFSQHPDRATCSDRSCCKHCVVHQPTLPQAKPQPSELPGEKGKGFLKCSRAKYLKGSQGTFLPGN